MNSQQSVVSTSSLLGFYLKVLDQAHKASNHDDAAAAAAFYWVSDSMERTYPFLKTRAAQAGAVPAGGPR